MRAAWALLLLAFVSLVQADLRIKNVDRKINLKTQVAKVTDVIEVTSKGESTEMLLCYPSRLGERIARLRVTIGEDKPEPKPAAAPSDAPAGVTCFSVPLSLADGATASVEAAASITGVMAPNPQKISQHEPLLVEYEDSLFAVSPYKIKQQTTTFTLPTDRVESASPKDKASVSGSKVTYGPLGSSKPWSLEPLKVHFEHSKQFKKVLTLVREIEVSHWGNIYVEESYIIQNAGAEHKGQFSRLQHTYNPTARATSFQQLKARLPPAAHSLYYKDLIGNVSSSNTRRLSKETVVDIGLRYPLMGGWKADFVLGYSLPLNGFLFRRPKRRTRLIMDLSSPIDDVVVEQLETRVVLPEGSTNIKYTLPFDMEVSWDKKYTYLDTAGRPVLVLRKSNLTPLHNKPFAVDYTFGTNALMREPLLLVAVFAALFAAYAAYNRLELTISRDDAWLEARTKEKAGATLEKISAVWDAESRQVDRVVAAAEALAEADAADAAAARQDAEARLRALEAQAKPLFAALEAVSPKAAAAARDHAERGKALHQRAVKLLADKADHLRKGVSVAEASKRVSATTKTLQEARAEWAAAGAALCD